MTDAWESITRETVWLIFRTILEDVETTAEEASDTLYWDHDLSPEQIERLRQAIHDLEYATEEYLASVCEGTEPWTDERDRSPSWSRASDDDDRPRGRDADLARTSTL